MLRKIKPKEADKSLHSIEKIIFCLLSGSFNIRSLSDAILVSTWLHFSVEKHPKTRFGSPLGRLGQVLGRLGGILGRLRMVLESSWVVLGRLVGLLDLPSGYLEATCGHLEAT